MAADPKTQVVITAKDETAAGFASAGAGLQRLTGQFVSLINPVAAAATAMTGASAAIVASVKAAIDTGDQFNKLSQKTGIAVESLSALAYASELSDVSIESLANGVKKLSVNMSEAAVSVSGKAAEAFKALGISVKNADGTLRGSEDVLADIADKFAGMKDGAGKAALSVALFGKAGTDLIPFLNQGGKGIAELTAEAEKLGLIMTGKTAKAAEEFNDNIKKLSLSTSALGKSITADLIGPLAEYTRLMVEARKEKLGLFSSAHVAFQLGDASNRSLADLRDREATLKDRIKKETPDETTNPLAITSILNAIDLPAARTELALLQGIIKEREKLLRGSQGQVRAADNKLTEKVNAPAFGGKDGGDREAAYLASLGNQLNAASGDVSEYSKQLLATTQGPAKEFSRTTKDAALALAQKIDRLKDMQKALTEHIHLMEKVSHAEESANKAVEDFRFKQDQSVGDINNRIDMLGKTPFEVKQIEAARKVQKEYEDTVKKINEELLKIGKLPDGDERRYGTEKLEKKKQEAVVVRNKAQIDTADVLAKEKAAQDALNASWEYGADTALRKYQEEITNVAATVESATTRAFKSMEDALVTFATKGKVDFKSLADSIITDLVRIQIQQSIMKPLTDAVKDSGGLSGLFGMAKSFFGGGYGDTAGVAAGVPRYAQGTPWVPNDGLAYLHKGEAVIPANFNNGSGGGSSVVVNASIDARGADATVVPQINAALANMEQRIYRNVPGLVSRQQLRNRITPMSA